MIVLCPLSLEHIQITICHPAPIQTKACLVTVIPIKVCRDTKVQLILVTVAQKVDVLIKVYQDDQFTLTKACQAGRFDLTKGCQVRQCILEIVHQELEHHRGLIKGCRQASRHDLIKVCRNHQREERLLYRIKDCRQRRNRNQVIPAFQQTKIHPLLKRDKAGRRHTSRPFLCTTQTRNTSPIPVSGKGRLKAHCRSTKSSLRSPLMVALSSPIPRKPAPLPRSASAPTTQTASDPCACYKTYNLQVEQGATLSTKITLTLNGVPVDLTGATFQFTAKLNPSDADSAPTTVQVDWQETATPTQGVTWLVVPANVTYSMQLAAYSYQVRMVSTGGVVTPIVKGAFTVVQPVSARGTTAPIINPGP